MTDTITISKDEYEALKALAELTKVLRAWYYTSGSVQDEYRGHDLYPSKHGRSMYPLWHAINTQIKTIDEARKHHE